MALNQLFVDRLWLECYRQACEFFDIKPGEIVEDEEESGCDEFTFAMRDEVMSYPSWERLEWLQAMESARRE